MPVLLLVVTMILICQLPEPSSLTGMSKPWQEDEEGLLMVGAVLVIVLFGLERISLHSPEIVWSMLVRITRVPELTEAWVMDPVSRSRVFGLGPSY